NGCTKTDKEREIAPRDQPDTFRHTEVLRRICPDVIPRFRQPPKIEDRTDQQHEHADQKSNALHRIRIGHRAHAAEPAVYDHDGDEEYYTNLVGDGAAGQAGHPLSYCNKLLQKEIAQGVQHDDGTQYGHSLRLETQLQPVHRRHNIMLSAYLIQSRGIEQIHEDNHDEERDCDQIRVTDTICLC